VDIKQEKAELKAKLTPAEFNELEDHMRHMKNFFLFCKDHKDLVIGGQPMFNPADDGFDTIIDDFLAP